jgi:hypothetical protein
LETDNLFVDLPPTYDNAFGSEEIMPRVLADHKTITVEKLSAPRPDEVDTKCEIYPIDVVWKETRGIPYDRRTIEQHVNLNVVYFVATAVMPEPKVSWSTLIPTWGEEDCNGKKVDCCLIVVGLFSAYEFII